jgi:nucleotide-binding universal stress UspA family protein
MEERFRLLVGYDGSEYSSLALDDLRRAGLPESTEALVLSAAFVFIPPEGDPDAGRQPGTEAPEPTETLRTPGRVPDRVLQAVAAAEGLAEGAASRIAAMFPRWSVRHEAAADYPSWAIIKAADSWKPDLILLGSHGRSALGRLILGSVSQTVITNARCSVRVGRGDGASEQEPVRLVVGYDGSPDADGALGAIARRRWPEGSSVSIVTAYQGWPAAVEEALRDAGEEGPGFAPPASAAHDLAGHAANVLAATSLGVSTRVGRGDPRDLILSAADGADCIFVGARGKGSGVEHFPLGSVALGVAARAGCSVEVVRFDASQ